LLVKNKWKNYIEGTCFEDGIINENHKMDLEKQPNLLEVDWYRK
jgi:hypothetical protein